MTVSVKGPAKPSPSPEETRPLKGKDKNGLRHTLSAMLDPETTAGVTLEPLDDWIVVEPLDDSELPSGLIVPVNESTQTRSAIVVAVGPEVTAVEPGEKVLFPRDAGYEVRMARSSHRVRVLKREDLLARIHD